MEEYYFSAPVGNSKMLCIGPVTREEAANAEAPEFCDGLGYYVFVADASQPRSPIEILGKLLSDEAAYRLSALLAARTQPIPIKPMAAA